MSYIAIYATNALALRIKVMIVRAKISLMVLLWAAAICVDSSFIALFTELPEARINARTLTSYGRIGPNSFNGTLPLLQVEGQFVVDGDGRQVALRGIGGDYRGYKDVLSDVLSMWEERLQWMKTKGFNVVRLAFNILGIAEHNRQLDYTFMDPILDLFEEYEVYAILDCHHSSSVFSQKDQWIAKWVEIAQRYKDRSVVAGYEIAAEAIIGYTAEATRQNYKDCINAIRQVDSKHIIFAFEYVKTASTIRMVLEGVSWVQNEMIWRPEDPPPPNTVIKTGGQWLVLRSWTLAGGPLDHPAYLYYRDKFDLAYSWASQKAHLFIVLRNLFNVPVWNGEFGFYDYDEEHANFAGIMDLLRLSEEQSIPWTIWSWDALFHPNAGNWTFSDLDRIFPTFTNPYSGNPQLFNPKPFDLTKLVANYFIPYSDYDPGKAWLLAKYHITFSNACKVRVRVFDGYPDERELTNMIDDYVFDATAGTTLRHEVAFQEWLVTPYELH